jgi:hypothetical protein
VAHRDDTMITTQLRRSSSLRTASYVCLLPDSSLTFYGSLYLPLLPSMSSKHRLPSVVTSAPWQSAQLTTFWLRKGAPSRGERSGCDGREYGDCSRRRRADNSQCVEKLSVHVWVEPRCVFWSMAMDGSLHFWRFTAGFPLFPPNDCCVERRQQRHHRQPLESALNGSARSNRSGASIT